LWFGSYKKKKKKKMLISIEKQKSVQVRRHLFIFFLQHPFFTTFLFSFFSLFFAQSFDNVREWTTRRVSCDRTRPHPPTPPPVSIWFTKGTSTELSSSSILI
jgi:hypothetical protein